MGFPVFHKLIFSIKACFILIDVHGNWRSFSFSSLTIHVLAVLKSGNLLSQKLYFFLKESRMHYIRFLYTLMAQN